MYSSAVRSFPRLNFASVIDAPHGRVSARVVVAAILLCLAAAVLVLAVIGAVRWYSPVPYWDMWDGYLIYYLFSVQSGIWAHVFAQANEHRVTLSHLLFLG
jgi:hypothetical protein